MHESQKREAQMMLMLMPENDANSRSSASELLSDDEPDYVPDSVIEETTSEDEMPKAKRHVKRFLSTLEDKATGIVKMPQKHENSINIENVASQPNNEIENFNIENINLQANQGIRIFNIGNVGPQTNHGITNCNIENVDSLPSHEVNFVDEHFPESQCDYLPDSEESNDYFPPRKKIPKVKHTHPVKDEIVTNELEQEMENHNSTNSSTSNST